MMALTMTALGHDLFSAGRRTGFSPFEKPDIDVNSMSRDSSLS